MVQWLRALVALTKDPGSVVPGTNPAAYGCHVTSVSRGMSPFGGLCGCLHTNGAHYCSCHLSNIYSFKFSFLNLLPCPYSWFSPILFNNCKSFLTMNVFSWKHSGNFLINVLKMYQCPFLAQRRPWALEHRTTQSLISTWYLGQKKNTPVPVMSVLCAVSFKPYNDKACFQQV